MHPVQLFIYDLSNGLAAQLSLQLTGKFFKAIHHTSIVYHDREYFFGRFGVEFSTPRQSPYGTPVEERMMGSSAVTTEQWQAFLKLCEDSYGIGKYHLLEHNCNTFSDAALQFLLQKRLDPEILSLPHDFLSTPLGLLLRPQIDAMYNVRAQPSTPATEAAAASSDNPVKTDHFYRFATCPTLSKLFGSLPGEGKDLGRDTKERSHLQKCTEVVLSDDLSCQKEVQCLVAFLKLYFAEGGSSKVYPGLDLLRVLILRDTFQEYLSKAKGLELFHTVLTLQLGEEKDESTLIAFLKLACNAFSLPMMRAQFIDALTARGNLDLVSNGALSGTIAIVRLSLKAIFNYFISREPVSEDFAVASLAAVAECSYQEEAEVSVLRQKVLREILRLDSQAVQDMIELLDIESPTAN